MQFYLLCVAKPAKGWVKLACTEYEKRLQGQLQLQVKEVSPITQPNISSVDRKKKEAERLDAATPKDCLRIALDERGASWSTQEFATLIDQWKTNARSIVCYIGGADGLDEDFRQQADLVWSLSKMTLPHQFARVMFTEQLYRAMSILNNHPYHRV